MKLSCCGGVVDVSVGDVFLDSLTASRWEVVGFLGEYTYSPSALGGTPTLACRCLSDINPFIEFVKGDGLVDFCGDSVAAAILSAQSSKSGCER